MGSLYAEDPCLGSTYMELGRDLSLPYGLNPSHVALGGDWDFAGFAQGDTIVPAEGVKTLGAKQNLRCLHLALKDPRQGYHGPSGVSYLAGLDKLEDLAFTNDLLFADVDLVSCESMRSLRSLSIASCNVTDRGMAALGKLR